MRNHVAVCLSGVPTVVLLDFDRSDGRLREVGRELLPGVIGRSGMMPMAVRRGRDRAYLVWRGDEPSIHSFALDLDAGVLSHMGYTPVAASLCHVSLSADERLLLGASFPDSAVTVSPIDANGFAAGPVSTRLAPNAHCIVQAPSGWVYATSLKSNFIQQYDLRDGALHEIERTATSPGARHLVFSSDGRWAFLVSEFMGSITSFEVDLETGRLKEADTAHFAVGIEKPWAAEIRIGASNRFVFVSERQSSRLISYRIGASGELDQVADVAAPECPRAFDCDANGEFLFAAGELNAAIWTYKIEEGVPQLVSKQEVGPQPSWVTPLF